MIQGQAIKTAKEYYATPTDSSSSLKEFSLDRKKYKKRYIDNEKVEEEVNQSATMGQLVELLLFEPSKFDEKFSMSSVASTPSGNMLLFCEALYKHTIANSDENGNVTIPFEEIAKLAYKDSGYKWTFDKVLEKFVGTDNEIWYKEIREVRTKGLTVISLNDVQNAERIVNELKTNEFTAPILNLVNSDRYTILIQHQVEGYEIDGLPLKSMMDLIIIDSKEKTISCFDLKCTYSVEEFVRDYYMYRRSYFQTYLYNEACHKLKEDLNLEYYEVKVPKYIVCDSIGYYASLIYAPDSNSLRDAYNGFNYNGKYYPGIRDTIADLKWAKEAGIWNMSRINYLNRGIVSLKN